ncbi:Uncharacterized membrane protein YgdD, TMEM256/DUF423 family [Pustulibacterium marinum]|uniref:Uncharacterized membrane protein YgdD, TMEM256/DUF423 family n=1 Tax=Pustulibacterium marinum TaxID=1224947 RepID=A0A1I7EY43_9FLAO|nr:DUF423 domain-containing protein [Pustulibacterium marinum]SFU28852.1 Uncharacterized membrane protein YgdD, TMEM256/DUF423 family [Pustulibacterium marinum]
MKTQKYILTTAAFLGMLTVILGAFGAHGLKKIVDADAVATYETGIRYQMYHVFALLFLGLSKIKPRQQKIISVLFLIGILFFSGSIYLLTFKSKFSVDISFLGPITPVGGLFLIAGWAALAYSYWKK